MSTGTTEPGASDKIVLQNIINGETSAAADGATMDIIDPSTGAVYATSPLSGPQDVDRAYAAATMPTPVSARATPTSCGRVMRSPRNVCARMTVATGYSDPSTETTVM